MAKAGPMKRCSASSTARSKSLAPKPGSRLSPDSPSRIILSLPKIFQDWPAGHERDIYSKQALRPADRIASAARRLEANLTTMAKKRDYSLVGESTRTAIETGLASA